MEYNQIEAFIYCWLSPFVVSYYSSYKITILSPLLNCCCVKVLLCLALFENNTLMFVWPARWCLIEINFYSFLLFRCKKVARKIHNISLIIQDRPNKAENIQAKLKVWIPKFYEILIRLIAIFYYNIAENGGLFEDNPWLIFVLV